MRVTHLGKFYPPAPGGMERVVQSLAEGERSAGVDTRVLVVGTTRRTRHESWNGVPVSRAAAWLRVGSVSLAPGLIPLLRALRTDVLVLHEPNPMALLAYFVARPRCRLIVWYHSEVLRPRWRYRLFYEPFLSPPLRHASRIAVSSPALVEYAEALAPHRRRCEVIPFGLDISPVAESAVPVPPAEIRSTADSPVALFVGRLVPYKGVEILIEALMGAPGVALAIIGDGPLRARLGSLVRERQLEDRVSFLGSLPDRAVAAWYERCDFLVLPSVTRAEAFGLVQLEAMARGKPVISTRLATGVPWVNQHSITGLTVPPGDASALSEALQQLAGDRQLRQQMGAAARARYETEFTRERMIARTVDMYRRVCREPLPDRRPLAKRGFDMALSGAGLVLSLPVWLAAAAAIKLEDGGPVFFPQERVGQNGSIFRVLKFRSMRVGQAREDGLRQAAAGDARITRVGRVMRATAMDELPQLLNILRGDMSFVGPRALMPGEIETGAAGQLVPIDDVPGYRERTVVQPGLTGIAQIYAPRDVTRRHKFRYDRLYVRRRSLWLDIRLILLSFWISMRGTWEHRQRKF